MYSQRQECIFFGLHDTWLEDELYFVIVCVIMVKNLAMPPLSVRNSYKSDGRCFYMLKIFIFTVFLLL